MPMDGDLNSGANETVRFFLPQTSIHVMCKEPRAVNAAPTQFGA